MKRVLVAVDEMTSLKPIAKVFTDFIVSVDELILLHVERLQGKSLMIDMLGEAEIATLKESMEGTAYKDALDKRASEILEYFGRELKDYCRGRIRTLVRQGIPSEEILKIAEEENVEMIVLGQNKKRGIDRLIYGSVTREVERKAKVPVLVAKRYLPVCEEPYTWKDAYSAVSISTGIILSLFVISLILKIWGIKP